MSGSSLIDRLNEAGVPCWQLRAWCKCHDDGGRKDLCESCYFAGPEECDEKVIEVLVKRLINATGHVDEVLDQRDYWKQVADRMCNLVMGRDKEEEDE